MRVYDSPMTMSTVQPSMKLKNHESPITKLTNLTDLRNSYHQSRIDNVLNDRSNEIFVPRNASKYIQEPFEKKYNRQKEIQEIRKKYYEQSDSKNTRSVSQKYDRYEIYRAKELNGETQQKNYKPAQESSRRQFQFGGTPNRILDYTPNSKPYKDDKNVLGNNYQNISPYSNSTSQKYKAQQPREYGKQNVRPSVSGQQKRAQINTHLERISQASNSNYETLNRNAETFSPQKNRVKSSFVLDDRSNKRGMNSSNYFQADSLRNKDNYKSIIKETSSVYEQSAKNSGNGKLNSSSNYYDKDSAKLNRFDPNISKVQSRVQPYDPKPFNIDDNVALKQVPRQLMRKTQIQTVQKSYSNNAYPTIYDKFLPKSPVPSSTNQKSTRRQQQSSQRSRTLTDYKKAPTDRIKESNQLTSLEEQKNQIKRRVLNFADDDRMKQIEKRLKQKQIEFKKKQESMKTKCEKNYDRRGQLSVSKQDNQLTMKRSQSTYTPDRATGYQNHTPSTRQNVDKEIERLSSKIKEFEDRKKQLNIESRAFQNTASQSKAQESDTPKTTQSKDFENARKALQEYRQGSRPKSNSQVYELSQYRIQSSTRDEQQTNRRPTGFMDKQKQPSKRCDFIQNTKPMYSEKTLMQPKREAPSRFGIQLFKIQCEESDQLSSCRSKNTNMSTSTTNANQCRNQFEMYRRTDQGIEQRKKRLQQNKKGSSQQMKRLVAALSQQSIYDEQFRNCKIWFHNQREESKWLDLKQVLKSQCDAKYTELRDKTIAEFHICEDENNPFFSVNQQSKFTYQALVRSYVTCKKYWQQNIQRRFEKNCLKAQGLTIEKLDLEKKGFINLEDFVRFLNFESGNFYRNRDLILIFKRFLNERDEKGDKSLTIEKIFDVVSC